MHWADQKAEEVIEKWGDDVTVASGITPSGSVHIGNFREEMTVDLVARALRDAGASVRYIHSWDDFDVFRKVPSNIPDEWEQYLGLPHSKVPDPWDCHDSYADHFEQEFEETASQLGVEPEYIYQTEMYEKCAYAQLIREALEKKEKVLEILNKYRKEPRPDDWLPVMIYCPECWKEAENGEYLGEHGLTYTCPDCGEGEIDFSEDGYVKLRWRVDWPMRWVYEDVAFEPGGKEHSTPGGSRDTAVEIVRDIFDGEPPAYQMYDFVVLKDGGKMSSSEGNVVTPGELLEVMDPAVVRFLYAGTKPVKEFAVGLDEEIFKTYEDFYTAERIFFEREEEPRNEEHWKRVYELSKLDIPDEMPPQIGFQHLSFTGQIYEGDEALEALERTGHVDELSVSEKEYVLEQMERATSWAIDYGGEEYHVETNDEVPEKIKEMLTDEQEEAMGMLVDVLDEDMSAEEVQDEIYDLADIAGGTGEVFTALYLCLLGEERGPRAGQLVTGLGVERVKKVLRTLEE